MAGFASKWQPRSELGMTWRGYQLPPARDPLVSLAPDPPMGPTGSRAIRALRPFHIGPRRVEAGDCVSLNVFAADDLVARGRAQYV